jgi:rare lipoprotein A
MEHDLFRKPGSTSRDHAFRFAAAKGARGLMGKRAGGGRFGPIAPLGAVVLGCLVLANCSASKFSSKYGDRVVADGEPVPKGGGSYRVGQPYTINGRTYYPTEYPSYRAEGIASWYGPDFHGRLTANGEIFDMHGISAAHPTLPIPSYARVTNLDNGRSIIVRVNDRGPYARDRIIDVSIGAANALRFYGEGLAHVRVEYIGRAPIEGSDDRVLLATLREGKPAPVPPQLMLASTAPFDPRLGESFTDEIPIPAGRPYTLGTDSNRPARLPATNVAAGSFERSSERSLGKLPGLGSQKAFDPDPMAANAGPVAAFSPPANDRANDRVLGLMSGRGLY